MDRIEQAGVDFNSRILSESLEKVIYFHKYVSTLNLQDVEWSSLLYFMYRSELLSEFDAFFLRDTSVVCARRRGRMRMRFKRAKTENWSQIN